jgi:hypothetical protein
MVSFDELKEMERSRDEGDGFGGARSHVPLHVAGRDSDANSKSSWYHYLKAKCGESTYTNTLLNVSWILTSARCCLNIPI